MLDVLRFKHRIVRDLAWVIASPPLVCGDFDGVNWCDDDHCAQEYQACLPALMALDQNPQPLLGVLSQLKSRALGHRFEALIGYWLTISPNYQILTRNLQLHHDGRTLGELDFIVRDLRSDAVIHLEVSVKFYMGLTPQASQYYWFGPNLKDCLGKKIDHLKQHQTQLSVLYPELMPQTIDQRCCCVKGRLFYPEQESGTRGPNGINPNHLRGVWGEDVAGFVSDNDLEFVPSNSQYLAINKPQWLSEFSVRDIEKYEVAVDSDFTKVSTEKSPTCFVIVNAERELIRYFEFPAGYFESVSGDS
ncbi:DUF1853 family protein [Leucothrix mucor]|uniref:DUF1853 family protein n=1 Tax=Leucothrix mucor TaxID=45248 RepID=UPI0003B4B125|nr:DUF1853 family protein [Leucothrix mucor]